MVTSTTRPVVSSALCCAATCWCRSCTGVTFEELDDVSPMLASRGGFSTAEEPIEDIIAKLAELVEELADEEADELIIASGAS